MNVKRYKVVDLFCGCGGMSMGFSNAGYDIIAGLDNWDKAIEVYRHNFNHIIIKQDLSDVEATTNIVSALSPDMIIGGPPCQDFSSAGKRNEDNGRGDLTISYAKIVCSIKPEIFVMENVARIVKTKKLETARSIFESAGYGLTEYVLDASLCGVPQIRKRFFLIGKLNEPDNFLQPFIERKLSKKRLSMKEYFGKDINFEFYYRHPRSYARRGIFSVNEPSPTIRGVNRPMPKGYPGHPGDATNVLSNIAPLSTEIRSRIQTFPKDFVFLGGKTDKEQMIGNAVPVNLAKFVGESIIDFLQYKESLKNESNHRRITYEFKEAIPLTLFEGKEKYPSIPDT